MLTDRLIATLAFVCLAGFLGILAFSVKRVDLGIAVGIGILLVAYDLWTQLGRRR